MSLPRTIAGRSITSARRVGGGDINDAYAVELDGGTKVFVKTRSDVPPGEYAAEAAGLRWLADGGARVPEVLDQTDELLALEWLDEGRLDADGEEELGRMLATLHTSGADRFGATPAPHGAPRREDDAAEPRPTRLGPLELSNEPCDSWPEFYAERRLRPLAARVGLEQVVGRVCDRLPDIAGPDEPPARLHGDLWSGNVLAAGGRPHLIDPAVYGGHREVDLAMLQLFGALSPRTLAAYDEVEPRADGHEERVGLYQLFPLLVHAVLFGGGYVASAKRTARRYAS